MKTKQAPPEGGNFRRQVHIVQTPSFLWEGSMHLCFESNDELLYAKWHDILFLRTFNF